MLTRILHENEQPCTFVDALHLPLSASQLRHIIRIADALLVTDAPKTLAKLQHAHESKKRQRIQRGWSTWAATWERAAGAVWHPILSVRTHRAPIQRSVSCRLFILTFPSQAVGHGRISLFCRSLHAEMLVFGGLPHPCYTAGRRRSFRLHLLNQGGKFLCLSARRIDLSLAPFAVRHPRGLVSYSPVLHVS